jgi:hypothetical protein
VPSANFPEQYNCFFTQQYHPNCAFTTNARHIRNRALWGAVLKSSSARRAEVSAKGTLRPYLKPSRVSKNRVGIYNLLAAGIPFIATCATLLSDMEKKVPHVRNRSVG